MDHNSIPIGQSFCGMGIKIHANGWASAAFKTCAKPTLSSGVCRVRVGNLVASIWRKFSQKQS
jgi:hypothetical protein